MSKNELVRAQLYQLNARYEAKRRLFRLMVVTIVMALISLVVLRFLGS